MLKYAFLFGVIICCAFPAARPSRLFAQSEAPMKINITSAAFAAESVIPRRFSGEGEDLSPPLSWTGVPKEAKELALVADDPDAPSAEPWVHWVAYNLSPALTGLKEGVPPRDVLTDPPMRQGRNSSNRIGYQGPIPPRGHGVHHYHFKLYALDAELDLAPGLSKNALLKAMRGHVIGEGELVGTYERR